MSLKSDKKTNLVWIDIEATGLYPADHKMLEICAVITNSDLEVLEEGTEIVIHQSDEVLANMQDKKVTDMHANSGLTEKSRESKVSIAEAEQKVLDIVKRHVDPRCSPMCGNSVKLDRMYTEVYMKELDEYLHYRLIDVSSIKELYKRWMPDQDGFMKKQTHRALDDIRESIEELWFYRRNFFKV